VGGGIPVGGAIPKAMKLTIAMNKLQHRENACMAGDAAALRMTEHFKS
jgi:hypothetical protein